MFGSALKRRFCPSFLWTFCSYWSWSTLVKKKNKKQLMVQHKDFKVIVSSVYADGASSFSKGWLNFLYETSDPAGIGIKQGWSNIDLQGGKGINLSPAVTVVVLPATCTTQRAASPGSPCLPCVAYKLLLGVVAARRLPFKLATVTVNLVKSRTAKTLLQLSNLKTLTFLWGCQVVRSQVMSSVACFIYSFTFSSPVLHGLIAIQGRACHP